LSAKNLVILGSTGSIGVSTLEVVARHAAELKVKALAAHSSIDLLEEQYRRFHPEFLSVIDKSAALKLEQRLKDEPVEVLAGEEEMLGLIGLSGVDLVLNAVVGAAGLKTSLETVKAGINLALANKESLVAGGPLFADLCNRTGARILPVDSEHSAVWQALTSGKKEEVRSIILTASGGPFRSLPAEEFEKITVEQALDHPTWQMGSKITIDSATLVNKGLEVIEAVVLFEMPADRIKVVVHPQSIIHSMVEYCDSSVVAQMSRPDMRLPIQYALFWPDRQEADFGRFDWNRLPDLTFEQPDKNKFPALGLAYEVAATGGTAPAVFNAANEIAVKAFLERNIKFTQIVDIIRNAVESVPVNTKPELQDVLSADSQAREVAEKSVRK